MSYWRMPFRIAWLDVPALKRIIVPFFSLNSLMPGTDRVLLAQGIVSSLTLVSAVCVFGPKLGPSALFGAMIAQWEADRPLRARLGCALLVGGIMTGTMALGVLIAPYPFLTVPVVVAFILLMTTGYYSFVLTRGPGPLQLFYAVAIGSYLGQFGSIGWQVTDITACAVAVAGVLAVVAMVFAPHGPEERAVAQAEQSVAVFVRGVNETMSARVRSAERHTAYAAVNRGWLTLRAAGRGLWGRRQAHVDRMIAANRRLSLRIVQDAYPHVDPDDVGFSTPALRGRPTWWWLVRANFHRDSVAWFTAGRVGLAGGIAGGLTQVFGLGHPYWAILSATLILHRWIGRLATTTRALHRAVGTLLGLGLVAAVLSFHPDAWDIIAIVVICIIAQNFLVQRNYALGIVFVTPMALLSIEVAGQAGPLSRLMSDRLTETVIGATVAILVTWSTGLHRPRDMMRARFRRSLRAIRQVLGCLVRAEAAAPVGIHARVVLQYELLTTLAVLTQAAEDDPSLVSWHDVEVALADLGYAALSACWLRDARALVSPQAALADLEALSERLCLTNDMPAALRELTRALGGVRARLAMRPAS
ncbi:hypothetical protein A0U93_08900 [Neoasaia chiangmaiensis]|uniref:Integral membrane bound transporter domain-containing protein n=3 Tax=Neoasaia chiangmaiensis TaxID=320497 RepID=A0A1U9KQG7_9PROT|nr:FUSC family protein [Neoasaia chiangmaiensis]AQS88043.1 hypothetical protein A0U93_08900 [Neoasaia chiangmaiensis]